jgi:serine/threonine protein kinase
MCWRIDEKPAAEPTPPPPSPPVNIAHTTYTGTVVLPSEQEVEQLGYKVKSHDSIKRGTTKYGKWYVLGRLGSGSFGTVDLGYDGKEYVAIKSLRSMTQTQQDEWAKETSIQMLLNPTGVTVKLYGFVNDRRSDLVMEAANAGDLMTYIERSSTIGVDKAEVRVLFKQLTQGLAKIHASEVVIRDIKPENILLFRQTDGLHAKYADFGLSSLTSQGSRSACGSPYYMPTEAFTLKPYKLKPSDVLALGLTLFQALSPTQSELRTEKQSTDHSQWPLGWYMSAPDLKQKNFMELEQQHPIAAELLRGMLEADVDKRLTAEQAGQHAWFAGK